MNVHVLTRRAHSQPLVFVCMMHRACSYMNQQSHNWLWPRKPFTALLPDIAGLEDALGDMDFKVAGSSAGVTALQLDVKQPGVPVQVRTTPTCACVCLTCLCISAAQLCMCRVHLGLWRCQWFVVMRRSCSSELFLHLAGLPYLNSRCCAAANSSICILI